MARPRSRPSSSPSHMKSCCSRWQGAISTSKGVITSGAGHARRRERRRCALLFAPALRTHPIDVTELRRDQSVPAEALAALRLAAGNEQILFGARDRDIEQISLFALLGALLFVEQRRADAVEF